MRYLTLVYESCLELGIVLTRVVYVWTVHVVTEWRAL